ncbi:MAG: trigger factor [Dysgonamonadaceae bacterium]|jgi:trigger factor|nr:trigger factor [Dysgonamonadaceae bacterium]
MKVTLNTIDPVNAELTVDIAKEDYAADVKKNLKKIRETAVIPGFRKGMAPESILQKMYGKSVLVEEVNRLVSDQLYNYIKENQLNILGEPLPSLKEQTPLNFDQQEDYSFTFDLGLSPKIDAKLTKNDKMTYYTIAASDEMIEKQVQNFKANYGSYEPAEAVESRDMVKGLLTELNEDQTPKEHGIQVPDAVLMPEYIKDADEKKKFIGAKLGDQIIFNPHKAYEGNEAEISSFLKIKKDEIAAHTGDFALIIEEITRYKEGELNQELFDRVYEPGTVTTEAQFREKIKETIQQQLLPESDYKFLIDAKQRLEDQAKDTQFPDAFLHRWLVASNPDRTEESLEADYPKIIDDLKFHLIKEQIVHDNHIEVAAEDIQEQAKKVVRAQFAQYGMTNLSDQVVSDYSKEMLKKEETVRNLLDKAVEEKLIAFLKNEVTLQPKEVSVEEFQKLFEK